MAVGQLRLIRTFMCLTQILLFEGRHTVTRFVAQTGRIGGSLICSETSESLSTGVDVLAPRPAHLYSRTVGRSAARPAIATFFCVGNPCRACGGVDTGGSDGLGTVMAQRTVHSLCPGSSLLSVRGTTATKQVPVSAHVVASDLPVFSIESEPYPYGSFDIGRSSAT